MIERDPLNLVEEFHQTFEHPIEPAPIVPSKKRQDLRKKLLREEVEEFCKGVDEGDLLQILDALCDIQYVLSGAVLEFGFKNNFPLAFREVHRSNMSKACENQWEAEQTIDKAFEEHGQCSMVIRNGKYFVYRDVDGKTIKNINYSPANLKKYL